MRSCVLILPAALRDAGNALAEAMGWGSCNYSVPLSADGQEPATHYGLHAWVADTFLSLLEAAGEGIMPEGLDYPAEDFASVVGALIASFRDDSTGHFADVIEANSLQVIEPED